MSSFNDLIVSGKRAIENQHDLGSLFELLDDASDVVMAGDSHDLAVVVVRHGGATVHTVIIADNNVVHLDVLTNYSLETASAWDCKRKLRDIADRTIKELQSEE